MKKTILVMAMLAVLFAPSISRAQTLDYPNTQQAAIIQMINTLTALVQILLQQLQAQQLVPQTTPQVPQPTYQPTTPVIQWGTNVNTSSVAPGNNQTNNTTPSQPTTPVVTSQPQRVLHYDYRGRPMPNDVPMCPDGSTPVWEKATSTNPWVIFYPIDNPSFNPCNPTAAWGTVKSFVHPVTGQQLPGGYADYLEWTGEPGVNQAMTIPGELEAYYAWTAVHGTSTTASFFPIYWQHNQ